MVAASRLIPLVLLPLLCSTDGSPEAACAADGAEVCTASSPVGEAKPAGCGCGALRREDFAGQEPAARRQLEADGRPAEANKEPGETEEEASVVYLQGGEFVMGLVPKDEQDRTVFPEDEEGPSRTVTVSPFGIGAFEVSNHRFARFVAATDYVTESERFGWSFGVEAFISPEVNATITQQVAAAPWWLPVDNADWRRPNGPDTSIEDIMDHPVTQVSLKDAEAFCAWSRPGGRLPTEEEWEFAARGGKRQRRYPWGHSILTGKGKDQHRANIWQSEVDAQLVREDGRTLNLYEYGEAGPAYVKDYYSRPNLALDGYRATAPVDAYGPQNSFGLYNMVGNVWEWTSTPWVPRHPNAPPVGPNTMVKRGGSFLCNPSTCNRFRCSARMMFTADSAASNVGFRCAYPPTSATL